MLKLKSTRVAHTDEVVPAGTMRYAPGVITGIHAFKGDSFIVAEFFNQDDLSDKAVYLITLKPVPTRGGHSPRLE
ncbi:MAG: hypothetical protein PHO37_03470 [Kiritimatiellae bacterium]|nr:hypothetical protein [Kiritimatiellia bacterium]